MWAFLDNVLDKGGPVALLFTIVILGCLVAIKSLWNSNQALHRQMIEELTKAYEKRSIEAGKINDRLTEILRETDDSNAKVRAAMEALATALQRGRR